MMFLSSKAQKDRALACLDRGYHCARGRIDTIPYLIEIEPSVRSPSCFGFYDSGFADDGTAHTLLGLPESAPTSY
jgi:hypothetical protein